MTKQQALAKHLEIAEEDVTVSTYDSDTFEAEGNEYLVLTDEEADQKAQEEIENSIWAFNADFILSECELDSDLEEMVQAYQENKCENANDALLSLINKTCGIEEFAQDAIRADGRGHFLAQYDFEEIEVANDKHEVEYYIYRTN